MESRDFPILRLYFQNYFEYKNDIEKQNGIRYNEAFVLLREKMQFVSFRFNRLSIKFLLAFLFLVLFTVIPIGWLSVTEQENMIRGYVKKTNDAFASFIASKVHDTITRTKDILGLYASMPDFQLMNEKEIRLRLESLLLKTSDAEPMFSGAGVYDSNKNMVVATGSFIPLTNVDTLFSHTLLHKYGVSLFKNLKTGNQSLPDHPSDAEFRVLIRDNHGISGALIVQLKDDYFQNALNEIRAFFEVSNEYSTIYVIDETEKIIAASKDADLKTGSVFPPELRYQSNIFTKELQDYTASSDTPPWKIVFVPKSSAYDNIVNFKVTFQYFLFFYLALAVAFGVYVTNIITTPLKSLVRSTEKISRGHLNIRIVPESNDEIGVLASKFDKMRKNLRDYQNHLKQKIIHLETLYRVGTIVSEEIEYKSVLRIILDTVVDVMAAEKGSIMLKDHKTGELKIAMAKGLKSEIIRNTTIPSGESVAGHVFATKQPLLVMDTMKNDVLQRIKKENVTPGTMLSVPLIHKEKTLGVLNISKSMPYGFSDYDLDLFRAIASLCATAIDNARLYDLAITDELTGLYVRRFFQQVIELYMHEKEKRFALIMMDLDHFKNINDTYGHIFGDEVLVTFANILKKTLRDEDIAFRLGGEEFAILCPDQNAEEALIPAQRLKEAINAAVLDYKGEKIHISASMGIADFPGDCNSHQELYELADQALYHSKESGRNCISLYREMKINGKA
jgi:diguanylate cyclase (GGDEF)-like protein